MSEAVPSEKNEKLPQERAESYVSEFGGIHFDEGGQAHAITMDGEGVVPIPNDMGEMISLALRVQDKVYSGEYPQLAKRFAALNCRKTVFATTGIAPVSELSDHDQKDIHGLEILFADVERFQKEGYEPLIVDESYSQIHEFLDEYEGSLPCTVHLFEFNKDTPLAEAAEQDVETQNGLLDMETVKKLHRIHSFVVLGKDDYSYVCFHKIGSEVDQPFVVCDLDMVLFPVRLAENRKGVVFAGPAR